MFIMTYAHTMVNYYLCESTKMVVNSTIENRVGEGWKFDDFDIDENGNITCVTVAKSHLLGMETEYRNLFNTDREADKCLIKSVQFYIDHNPYYGFKCWRRDGRYVETPIGNISDIATWHGVVSRDMNG